MTGDGLAGAIAALAAQRRVLVASDFDGVLAPFVMDPMAARPLPGTLDDLRALAALPRTSSAVVSGRDLDTLTALTGLEDSDVVRIGSHGAESSLAADPHAADHLDAGQRATLDSLTRELTVVTSAHPGSRIEHKPSAVVLHTRGLHDDDASAAEAAALEVAGRHTGITVLHGKHVVEVSVVAADKGTALMALKQRLGATGVAYLGDDVTDEHAFVVMGAGDVSVKVGTGATAARHRVAGPEQAAEVLHALLAARRSATS